MSRNFTESVIGMLGPARNADRFPAEWGELETALGVGLPDDYKGILGRYAPVQLNVHLFLMHPSTGRWNLGRWMRETVQAFSRSDLTDVERLGFTGSPFGAPSGLIPLLHTDRGENLFGAVEAGTGEWRFHSCNGDEPLYYEHRMSFSEWLHRYLRGEDMFGPGSGVFYPGPIVFESLPMQDAELSTTWEGPERGM
ncbi:MULTISPECIES: SMI1/KNR4 family protein [unclassified Streptomyces]|uniref:SMI1/KNR4 family protein n=1 Tax=unclassified Streptomyces TaxID=2593676 RepID=UPI000F6DAEC6|nr:MULTISPECIES: SMI1/KNR4 family protein [unclassified Streptomyces]AZM59285.1 SMI1/KNR4 family protein [Streptomyces sp. WAC 01438]RSM89274.1 SMI1/KNR4 family protein [Streptomyces sp. WAC 01420]